MPSTVGGHHGYMFYQDDAERSRSRSPPPPYFIEDHMLEGKWLLFYDRATIDEKWMAACELFRAGRLPGISSLKVSCSETFVIVLYADSIEEERVMEAGLNLVNLMKYHRTAVLQDERTDPSIYSSLRCRRPSAARPASCSASQEELHLLREIYVAAVSWP